MAQKFEQIHVPVMVTVQKPKGSTWTEQEIANVIKIKSMSPKDVKVVGHHVEQAPE